MVSASPEKPEISLHVNESNVSVILLFNGYKSYITGADSNGGMDWAANDGRSTIVMVGCMGYRAMVE